MKVKGNRSGYTMQVLREIAISSVRSCLRQQSRYHKPFEKTGNEALAILEDMCKEPAYSDNLFKVFYDNASERQLDLFVKEWDKKAKMDRQRFSN